LTGEILEGWKRGVVFRREDLVRHILWSEGIVQGEQKKKKGTGAKGSNDSVKKSRPERESRARNPSHKSVRP